MRRHQPRAPPAPQATLAATETTPVPKSKVSSGRGEGAPRSEPAALTTPAAAPALPPLTFKDVKMLAPEGKTKREREAVLTLAGDHLSLLDKSTQAELLSLPYSSITQSFYSLSRQPKWKGGRSGIEGSRESD